eukprot:374368-Prymnesium_polylepis.1
MNSNQQGMYNKLLRHACALVKEKEACVLCVLKADVEDAAQLLSQQRGSVVTSQQLARRIDKKVEDGGRVLRRVDETLRGARAPSDITIALAVGAGAL